MLNTWSMQGMPALASREEQQQPSLTAPAASMLASAMRGKMGAMPMLPGRRAGIMTSGIKPLQVGLGSGEIDSSFLTRNMLTSPVAGSSCFSSDVPHRRASIRCRPPSSAVPTTRGAPPSATLWRAST